MAEQFIANMESYEVRASKPSYLAPLVAQTMLFSGHKTTFKDGKITEESMRLLYQFASKTAEWKKSYDEIKGTVVSPVSERVFSQGLGVVVKVNVETNSDGNGFSGKAMVEEEMIVHRTAPTKKAVTQTVRNEVVELIIEYAAWKRGERTGVVEMEKPLDKDKTYGKCEKCGYVVKLLGHDDRCKPIPDDFMSECKRDPHYRQKAYIGDLAHKAMLANAAILRGEDCTHFSMEYIKASDQAIHILDFAYANVDRDKIGHSEHSLGDLFEYVYAMNEEFRKEYAKNIGISFVENKDLFNLFLAA